MNITETMELILEKANTFGAASIRALEGEFSLTVWLDAGRAAREWAMLPVRSHLLAGVVLYVHSLPDAERAADAVEAFAKWCGQSQRGPTSWLNFLSDEEKAAAIEQAFGRRIVGPTLVSPDDFERIRRMQADIADGIRALDPKPMRLMPDDAPGTARLVDFLDTNDALGFAPTRESRYAAFRSAVERVVHEEAPLAQVVTDMTQETPDYAARLLYEIRLGDVTLSGSYLADEWEDDEDENLSWLRTDIGEALRKIGARKMGKRP
jgi:hypothetical protein